MQGNSDKPPRVELSRLTVATAVDFLREYEQELRHSGAEGEYTREVRETIENLDTALGNEDEDWPADEEDR